jgi:diguanylate cyclase (GGDEF)-like protein/PAS domain S-box-containing protein
MNADSQDSLEQALQNCANEPIHQLGLIQPHGALLSVSIEQSLTILQVSQNLGQFLDLPTGGVNGKPLSALFGKSATICIQQLINHALSGTPSLDFISVKHQQKSIKLQVRAFPCNGVVGLELTHENNISQREYVANLLSAMQQNLFQADDEIDLHRYFGRIVTLTRDVLEFDRVMVYRFDSNWDGEVIAESRNESATSYLGNRFPASDIPPQARRLYTINLVRSLADIDAEAVSITPSLNPHSGQPLDLTHSALRSFSQVHLEYLRNMGVRASMSISLMQSGRLWGLIACHHAEAKRVPNDMQQAAMLISRMASSKLSLIEIHEQRHMESESSRIVSKLLKSLSTGVEEGILPQLMPSLLDLMKASGVILMIEGKHYIHGEVPSPTEIEMLLSWLGSRPSGDSFACEQLAQQLPGAFDFANIAAGLLAAPITRDMRSGIIWLRQEKIRSVKWAGNPKKVLSTDATGKSLLSPRTSFSSWIELWSGHSEQWSFSETSSAVWLAQSLTSGLEQKTLLDSEIQKHLQAKQSLQSSEQKLAAILDGVEAHIYIKDINYRYQYANRLVCQLFGKPLADVIGREDSEFFDLITANKIRLNDKRVLVDGERVSKEEVNTSADGKLTSAFLSIKIPLRSADGKIYGLCGISYDITERKQSEYLLQKSQQILHDAQRIARVGNWEVNFATNHVYWSEELYRMQGLDPSSTTPPDYTESAKLFTPESWDLLNYSIGQTAKTGVPYELELEMIKPDDSHGWMLARGEVVKDANNVTVGVRGVAIDITERKIAEDNLRITASVFDNTQEAILITDASNTIIDVNVAFTHITGYSREEAIGKNPKLISSGRQGKDFYANLWASLERDSAWRGEIWNRRKSGEIYPEMLSISVHRDSEGKVIRNVAVFSDITALKKHEDELIRVAHFDALTCIPNRLLLADRMKQAISQSSREQCMMAVCYLDLDGFKSINDALGHHIGDEVLIEIAKRIGNTIRGGDTVARLGGDEFVILLLGLSRGEECVVTLERLLASIVEPISVDNNSITISASIGVSIYPSDDEDPDTLLRHADQAMYIAKNSGKNRFHIYDVSMDQRARIQNEFLKSIHLALEQNQFELYYQPKINLRSKDLVGAEALIRWRHPDRGLLSPAEFLRHVENTDLDIKIGEWVITTALAQMRQWRSVGLDIEVSINISGYHMESAGFVSMLEKQLKEYPDLPFGKFQIEILETVALNDIGAIQDIIESCHKIGVGFALDDFGTGYCSLTYLSHLPVDVLKIDQSFVRDMLEDKGDRAIVQGIVALAHAFERHTVAEGIETKEHYQALLNMGCEIGQGYGIARPMPAAALAIWNAEVH